MTEIFGRRVLILFAEEMKAVEVPGAKGRPRSCQRGPGGQPFTRERSLRGCRGLQYGVGAGYAAGSEAIDLAGLIIPG